MPESGHYYLMQDSSQEILFGSFRLAWVRLQKDALQLAGLAAQSSPTLAPQLQVWHFHCGQKDQPTSLTP